jgi:hypothetical protein
MLFGGAGFVAGFIFRITVNLDRAHKLEDSRRQIHTVA